mgnify:CR=1 FL=1
MKNTGQENSVITSQSALDSTIYPWSLSNLHPQPAEEWDQMFKFLHISEEEFAAMRATVEVLLKNSQQFVIDNYQYLAHFPETAAILGWESGVDEKHLEERRRFFAIWVARLLGQDFSHDLANYLFLAGQYHAGHGPRKTHVPALYVNGAVSHTLSYFAHVLSREIPAEPNNPIALAGWGKVLSVHLQLMLLGYHSAIAMMDGDLTIPVRLFSKIRAVLNRPDLIINVPSGSNITLLLTRFFDYFPQIREMALDVEWVSHETNDTIGNPWTHVTSQYLPKPGWRILINGLDINYLPPEKRVLNSGDSVDIFPPGR